MAEPNPDYMDHTLVQEAAEEVNPVLFSFDDMIVEGNAKPEKRKVRRSIISRMLRLSPK